MKISNNLTFNKLQNYKSAESKQAVSKPFVQSGGINTSPAVSAQLYQAYNNISFGQKNSDEKKSAPVFFVEVESDDDRKPYEIFCRIASDSVESHILKIDDVVIDMFLKDEEGDLDEKALMQFISVYMAVLQGTIEEGDDINEFLNAIADGKSPSPKESNVIYINPNDEVRSSLLSALSEPSENFLPALLNGIKNEETRKDFAGFLSNALNEQFGNTEYQSRKAMERTINLFDICQNKDGFDFSNMREKMEIVKMLEYIEWDFGREEGAALDIIEDSKDEEGKFDIDCGRALCELVASSECYTPGELVSRRNDLLHRFTAMDSDCTKQIVDTMVKLSSIIQIYDEDTRFESVFGQAFNNVTGKYDEKAAQLLLELAPLVEDATEDMPIDTREDFENYKKTKQDLISGYFKQAKDKETGKIKEDAMSPADYISYLHFLY